MINTPLATPNSRQTPQIDSKIKQLQSTLQYKVQTFDGKRLNPRDECGPQNEIKKLVKQFDPLDDSNQIEEFSSSMPVAFRSNDKLLSNISERHPSLLETIPTNRVTAVLQNIQTNYGTTSRFPIRPTYSIAQQNHLASTAPADLFSKKYPTISEDPVSSFDPLAPTNEKIFYPPTSTETNGSNLIDFN